MTEVCWKQKCLGVYSSGVMNNLVTLSCAVLWEFKLKRSETGNVSRKTVKFLFHKWQLPESIHLDYWRLNGLYSSSAIGIGKISCSLMYLLHVFRLFHWKGCLRAQTLGPFLPLFTGSRVMSFAAFFWYYDCHPPLNPGEAAEIVCTVSDYCLTSDKRLKN